MTDYSTGWHVDSSINVHIVPRPGSRKLNSVPPMVVERFLDEMEGDGVGRGNQVNIFRVLKTILRDAYAKGAMADDPVKGVQEPEYVREQIHFNTLRPAKLKHRKAGEFREVPLPRSVREAIERYEAKYGTTKDGYLLRGPGGYFTEGMERRRVKKLFEDLPPEEGVGMHGFRYYFASNALGNGIPITDVAEWMGHKSIEETYRTYRHLMPGSITKAARTLGAGLWEAA
ncbi:tyrosine-type recombinase/integrase [Streptomyces sp. NPDC093089]|uniref:tyrosine-type recombinase/integrase n=1 Tax=Streptomyces sp. NPDC093089 TaxID=3366024 RepID=UPI003825E4AE